MSKQFWEIKHDWWEEDFKHLLILEDKFLDMLKKHTDDLIGDDFRDMVKGVRYKMTRLKKDYKKLYGRSPKIKDIKEDKCIFTFLEQSES